MNEFLQIVRLIQTTRFRALSAVNSELVNLYWQVGQTISMRLEKATWGDGMVTELAQYIQKNHPEIKGFDKVNLYRMCRFYETYKDTLIVAPVVLQLQNNKNEPNVIVAPLVRQLDNNKNETNVIVAPLMQLLQDNENEPYTIVAPVVQQLQETPFDLSELSDISKTILAQLSWSHHLILMGRCKIPEEREYYIRLCIRDHYSKRELDRQINSSNFERVMIGNAKLTETMRHLPQDMTNALKDSYVFAEILPETTKWLNVNNHRCNLWDEITPLTRTMKELNIN